MAADQRYVVMFRGVEVGSYDTYALAVSCCESLIDNELGLRSGPGVTAAAVLQGCLETDGLPRIVSPTGDPEPFSAEDYARRRAFELFDADPPRAVADAEHPQPPSGSTDPTDGPVPVYGGPPPFIGEPATLAYPPSPAPVYGGPPPQFDAGSPTASGGALRRLWLALTGRRRGADG